MKKCARLASLVLLCVASLAAQALTGWITDKNCAQTGKYAGEGHQKCVEAGQPIVFVSEKDQKVYEVTNPEKVKAFVGKKVALTGKADGMRIEAEDVKATD